MQKSRSALLIMFVVTMVLTLVACSKKSVDEKIIVGDLYKPGVTEHQMADSIQGGRENRIKNEGSNTKVQDVEVKYFDNLSTMLSELNAGRITYATVPNCVANYIVANNDNYTVENAGDYMSISTSFQIGVSDKNQKLLSDINVALSTLKANGMLDTLAKTYITVKAPAVTTIPKINGADTVKVVLTGDLPPLDYMTEGGSAAGYNVALLSELSKLMNINIELITADAASRTSLLSSGRADMIFWMRTTNVTNPKGSIVKATPENPEGVVLSDVYFVSEQGRLMKK